MKELFDTLFGHTKDGTPGTSSKAISQFGNNVYDITMMKSAWTSSLHVIRSRDNDSMKSTWIKENGLVAPDVVEHRW